MSGIFHIDADNVKDGDLFMVHVKSVYSNGRVEKVITLLAVCGLCKECAHPSKCRRGICDDCREEKAEYDRELF